MFSNAQHKNGWLCILQQLMINTVGYGACEKSTLFSENTWQSFKTCIWLVTVLLATMQAAENSHIPSVGRSGFQLWTHTQILAAFWTNSQFPRTQFQLPPTWEANNIAERPTCIQLNAHNILVGLVGIWLLQVCEDSLIYTIWWGDQIQWRLHSDEHDKIY